MMAFLHTRIRHLMSTLVIGFLAGSLFAQGPVVVAEMDTHNILLGQPVNLHLELHAPAGDSIVWPAWQDTLMKSVEILNQGKIDTSFDPSSVTTRILMQELTITSFDSGYYPIRPIAFTIANQVYRTEALLLEVHTVEVDTTATPKDIKAPIEVYYTWVDWLVDNWDQLLASVALLVGTFWLIGFLNRRTPKPGPIERKAAPARPAHEVALERLQQLEDDKLWQNNQIKNYHIQLSVILREYLESRFGIPALEQTSDEILGALNQVQLNEESRSSLRNYFVLADLVKFAKSEPLASENEMSLRKVREFVEQSIPRDNANEEGQHGRI